MDAAEIKKQLQSYAKDIGIDKIGFASAEPFDHLEASLRDSKAKGYTSGFEHPNIDERIYPDRLFPHPQTLIAIALAYPTRLLHPPAKDKDQRRGQFARASWGRDYHFILREKLELLKAYLLDLVPNAHCDFMVDTGPLMDVAVAERAGLGFIGRNGLLITQEFGSWVYLGELVTDLDLPPDERVPFGCGDCYRCVTACPTQALLGDGRMNAKKCLSFQTQSKGLMAEDYRRKIASVIYGCDICQLVCPYNQGKDFHHHSEMEGEADQVMPILKPMLTLSNRQFNDQFGHLAGSWRGKKPLQRNAIIALANLGDRSALPYLIQVMEEDVRPDIRATAAWSISRLQKFYNPILIQTLEDQLAKETDPSIIEEFTSAIDRLRQKRSNPAEEAD